MKDVIYGRQPVKVRKKGRMGRCDLGMVNIFLTTLVRLAGKHDSDKKCVATSLSLDTQSNKTFTCIIITAASLRAHSLHIHSLLNKGRKK